MMVRRFPLLAAACLLALWLACGDDDSGGDNAEGGESGPTSLATTEEAEYLSGQAQRMQTFAAEATSLNETAVSAFDPANPARQREEDGRAYAVAYEEFTRRRLDSLSESEPPASLQALHDDLISAASEAATLGEAQRERMESESVTDSQAFATLFAELNGLEVTQSYRDACAALVRRAVELELTVDFSCS